MSEEQKAPERIWLDADAEAGMSEMTLLVGDCIEQMRALPDASVNCCVTSPPYFGLRDYGVAGQIGLEVTPEDFVARLVDVFREVRRVLRDDGTLWLNLGDSYARNPAKGQHKPGQSGGKNAYVYDNGNGRASATFLGDGIKEKDLIGIPWRVAFALQADGWYLRQDIIWHKPNPMPESVRDRCTKAHEYVFLLSKGPRYYFDSEAIKEPVAESSVARLAQPTLAQQAGSARVPGKTNGNMKAVGNGETRNRRSVWTVTTKPFKGATQNVRQVPVAWDAPVDGKKRKASPDCPVHAGRPDQDATASCGERGADYANRTGSTGVRRDQGQQAYCAPTGQLHAQRSFFESLGFPDQQSSHVATAHSNQTSKTGLVLGTSRPCMPSVETDTGTGCTEAALVLSEPNRDTSESSISAVVRVDNRDNQSPDRTAGTSHGPGSCEASTSPFCTCEWYVEKVEKTRHFATFPPDLIEPCILAGCPPGGTVMDPFGGSGTTAGVALKHGRNAILCELNPDYAALVPDRVRSIAQP